MASLTTTVHVIPLDPVTGQWCGTCLLPSLILFPFRALTENPLIAWNVGTMEFCPECMDETRWVPRP